MVTFMYKPENPCGHRLQKTYFQDGSWPVRRRGHRDLPMARLSWLSLRILPTDLRVIMNDDTSEVNSQVSHGHLAPLYTKNNRGYYAYLGCLRF